MLFRRSILNGIRNGTVTLAFRRWRRPTVRKGGRLLTSLGELQIRSVKPVSLDLISASDAQHAGYESLEALLVELQRREEGGIFRIELGPLRPDPRIALRETPATEDELRELRKRLRRLDMRAGEGAWSIQVLELLSFHPGVRAGDLCTGQSGEDKVQKKCQKFKESWSYRKPGHRLPSISTGQGTIILPSQAR